MRKIGGFFGLLRRFAGDKKEINTVAEALDPVAYYKNRTAYIDSVKNQGLEAYPHTFEAQVKIPEFISKYSYLNKGEKSEDKVSLAGRIMGIRQHGKLIFYDLLGEGSALQVMVNSSSYAGDFESLHKIHRGDIVGIQGFPARSSPRDKPGELSILPSSIQVLSHCLHMLPSHSGLKHMETRFRQRYLDLITNKSSRGVFETRARIIRYLRKFLDNKGFLEVETPMMNLVAGGAAARPFETFHEDLGLKLFMRIAPELYLKQLVIGGIERVYEIGKQFRNEGIDLTHNPEFTTLEFYWAYSDYNNLINVTEELLSGLVLEVNGSYLLKYHPEGPGTDKEVIIDFTPPFKKLRFIETIENAIGVKLPSDLNTENAREEISKICEEYKINVQGARTTARLLDKLAGRFIEGDCGNPTFVVDHPQIMSPLAKYHRKEAGLSERFELFVNSQELCNAYTELNDPARQREMFAMQAKQRNDGDSEAQVLDESFCCALEYGLPPTAGWGLGIDRLTMLLTDKTNIKEVLLFPAMKPNDN